MRRNLLRNVSSFGRIHFCFSFKADFPTGINNRSLRVENEPREIAHPACAESTGGPHLWVIIAHSCMPRDKSEAIRKPALECRRLSLRPLFVSILANPWIVAQPNESRPSVAFSVLYPGAVPPLLEYPPTALWELSRKWDECQRGSHEGSEGGEGGGGLLRPPVIKETQDLSIPRYSFPCSLKTISANFEYFEICRCAICI